MTTKTIAPKTLALAPAAARRGTGGVVIGVANTGPAWRIGIANPDRMHHTHIVGPTGTGKTTALLHMALSDILAGRGTVFLDGAKGDIIRHLLAVMPPECADRLVIIDADETQAPPALNLVDPGNHAGSAHHTAAQLTAVMGKVWARWWGHRTADIAHHALLTLALTPGATLGHLPKLLSDTEWRAGVVARAMARVDRGQANTLAEFWAAYEQVSVTARAAATAPLLAKLRLVLAHPVAVGLFGVPASTFRLADILDGGILLVRLPKGQVGEDGTRLIGSLLLAGLWQAATARARLDEHTRRDAHIYIDECHNFLHLPIGLDDALAEARGLKVGFTLAHQYLGQLSDDMADAIDANARNKVYFALAPGDAEKQARHVRPYFDAGDLARLDAFEVVLRPIAGGRNARPCTVDTLPAPVPIPGRAEVLRAAARVHTGLDATVRAELLAAENTGAQSDSERASRPAEPIPTAVSVPVDPVRFLNTRPGRSRGSSRGVSRGWSSGREHPAQHPTPTGANPQPRADETEW
jgi:RecA/RadA recombinase